MLRPRIKLRLGGLFNAVGLVLAIALFLRAGAATAQDWPTRSITIVASSPAGGNLDVMARIYARELSKKFGQPVIVENRTGGNGSIGTSYVAKSKPDGYTLVVVGPGPSILNKLMYKSMSYDPDTELAPIILANDGPTVLAVNPRLPIKNLQDLFAYARLKNGGLTVGHGGTGGIGHLTAMLFLKRAKLDATLISYRGTAPLMTDLIGGQIDVGFPAYVPQVSALKVLNITSSERASFLPDVPTLRESGFDLVASIWIGLMGPAGMPRDVVMKINAAMNEVLKDPAIRSELAALGNDPVGGSPEDFVRLMDKDRALWAPIVSAAKISLD